MALQAKDLMIGDWVFQPSPDSQYPIRIEYGWQIEECVEMGYKPIPLNPEILEKNGFSLFGESIYVLYNNDNKTIKFGLSFNSEFRIEIGCKWRTIAFIHELQHALKLCGIEKPIEL